MVRDAQATRHRLLEAAAKEFADFGIAGARVDRIAEVAKANKAQIYHYFGSKDQLFDAVFDAHVADTTREAPFDVDDLPGYAARLFDGYERHPAVARLATWYRLERAGTQAPLTSIVDSTAAKVAAITRAQADGRLPSHFEATDLLGLVLTIAGMWTTGTPEYDALVKEHSPVHRRQVVIDSVTALLTVGFP